MNEGFVHLHLHTQYSLLDGACRIEQAVGYAKKLGQTAMAITDHGNMFGAFEFYKEAKKQGIKPIIGCEVYVAPRNLEDKQHGPDSGYFHLILLCKNNKGYQNLIKMVSEAYINGFYSKPRIDKKLLKKHSEGLIALSACLAGEVSQLILSGDYEKAKQTALWYDSVFGRDNYYLELQDHGMREQKQVNASLIRISGETGIPLVATNDAHYVTKDDSLMQKILLCISSRKTLGEDIGMGFETDEFYIKSEEEMLEVFPNNPEAVHNTALIAEKCCVEFETGRIKLPHFDLPEGTDHFEYFKDMCLKGFKKRYENPPEEYFDRLNYELSVIKEMGYIDYFLIVQDFVAFAKGQKIPVGPGRGSGAGCLCAYCIGITDIDPMKYNLLFERFLNPERVSMPDFDIDFCYERRGEVIEYVNKKYGSDHVSQIVTFGTMAAKAAVRDVGRVLGMPYSVVDAVAKLIPRSLHITLKDALKESSNLKKLYENDERTKTLIDLAMKVEGMPRHASTHAAGVVITQNKVSEYVPLATSDDTIVTQYTMTALEELGLLKMDFLGLRTLTVISDTEKEVRKSNPDFSIDAISLNDKEVFKMMSCERTDGVFQYESAGMKRVLSALKPTSIEDLIAIISLYRPGPMDSIDTYVFNKNHPEKIKYKTDKLKSILSVTYGCMVYQEQVMEICRELAGYSYGRADLVRRAMSKKKHDVMEKERHNFIYGLRNADGSVECEGAIARGVDERTANEIFDEMSGFASYAFNKSHAAAYAVLAYKTAYLKCHYPAEFFSSLFTSYIDNTNKIVGYSAECQRLGIKILPPSVNESEMRFTSENGTIRFGLLAVKNLGEALISKIIEQRCRNGKFKSLYDFCERLYGRELNRRALESLIKSGALDGLKNNRREMLLSFDKIMNMLEDGKRSGIEGQIGLFDLGGIKDNSEFNIPKQNEFSKAEKLAMEKEVTGMYLSDHPMSDFRKAQALGVDLSANIVSAAEEGKISDGDKVTLLGIATDINVRSSRNGSEYALLTLEDQYGDLSVTVFPKQYSENADILNNNVTFIIKGSIQLRDEEPPRVICDKLIKIESPDDAYDFLSKDSKSKISSKTSAEVLLEKKDKKGRIGLFLRLKSENDGRIEKVKNLLQIFDGDFPVYFYFNDTKKYIMLSRNEFIDLNAPLISELKKILGEENVVVNK